MGTAAIRLLWQRAVTLPASSQDEREKKERRRRRGAGRKPMKEDTGFSLRERWAGDTPTGGPVVSG